MRIVTRSAAWLGLYSALACSAVSAVAEAGERRVLWSKEQAELYEFVTPISRRLRVLLANPRIAELLDQKSVFLDEDKYAQVKDRSLQLAARSWPMIVDKESGLRVDRLSVCLADKRIFLSAEFKKSAITGWVPIFSAQEIDTDARLLLFLRRSPEAPDELAKLWKSRIPRRRYLVPQPLDFQDMGRDLVLTNVSKPEQWATWTRDLLRLGLNVEVKKPLVLTARPNSLEMRCFIKGKYDNHDATVYVSRHGLVFECDVYSEKGKQAPYSTPPAGERLIKDVITDLPFWPPSISSPDVEKVLRARKKKREEANSPKSL